MFLLHNHELIHENQYVGDLVEHNISKYANTNGITAVFLIHGFPVDSRMWNQCASYMAPLLQQFHAKVNVYAPDMPGAGVDPVLPPSDMHDLDTLADSYVSIMRDLGYEKAVWIGLSMGGYVVLDIQKRHPEVVQGIGLLDTKAAADSDQAAQKRFEIARICELEQTVEPVMHFAQPSSDDSTVKQSDEYVQLFTRWIHEQKPQGIAWRQRMAANRPDLTDQLNKIIAPVLVLCGDVDPSSSPEVMKPIAEQMKNAKNVQFAVIEDCGHFSAVEHPDQVAQQLVNFINNTL
ncbi:MAG: alpha/beta hydrolase [Bifidobacteriaceae bacterium]|nr:alpha/beta hydrolase [Bifidobacteriaceae bacterium]